MKKNLGPFNTFDEMTIIFVSCWGLNLDVSSSPSEISETKAAKTQQKNQNTDTQLMTMSQLKQLFWLTKKIYIWDIRKYMRMHTIDMLCAFIFLESECQFEGLLQCITLYISSISMAFCGFVIASSIRKRPKLGAAELLKIRWLTLQIVKVNLKSTKERDQKTAYSS